MLPAAFRHRRALPVASALALGASLASVTGAVTIRLVTASANDARIVNVVTLTTFVVGVLWSYLLHLPTVVTRRRIRLGWMLSVPLAALNGALACGALFALASERPGPAPLGDVVARFAIGSVMGATLGAMIWLPALLATLALFGLPLARAQRLAARGLAGEERGERTVGVVCALLALAGTAQAGACYAWGARAVGLLVALGVLGVVAGVTAAWLAIERAARRDRFVAQAEAGRVAGYRVDVVPEGKVLVRVTSRGEAYRAGEQFEAVYELASDGAARRALVNQS